MRLKEQVAIITGSSRGIGLATARLFLEEGAAVVLNGRNEQRLQETVEKLKRLGRVEAVAGDIANQETAIQLAERAKNVFGKIDVLVCNAGITRGERVTEIAPTSWEAIINTNVSGTFYCIQAVLPEMIAQKQGSIITLSSIYYRGSKGQLHYDTSKGAIVSMTRSLALELAKYSIRVNCVAPGLIDTDMPKVIPEKILNKLIQMIPFRRFGRPQEVAYAILFLASREASFITGQVLHVNGGSFLGG